jgi:glycosyltransferase involved in cell wall biosynthesis
MRVLAFGTYDSAAHPRIGVIIEGLRAAGLEVDECNVPLGLDTASRVAMLHKPWRVPLLLGRLGHRWLRLARLARRTPKPDAVLVGYLGHFDVRLARLLFRRTPIVLDHLVGASDTASDRRVTGGLKHTALRAIDAGALRSADVIVVDTEEHLAALPAVHRARGVVVDVGAPSAWFSPPPPDRNGPLKVVFFGLYTPLQGAPVIGAAIAKLAGEPIGFTMVGKGQDLEETRRLAAGNDRVTWLDWVPTSELPALVAAHDVCLGIFAPDGKGVRVVPNKVFQGAAAGCAVVTSDTAPQRRAMADAALLVPPGDPDALADALRSLAADPAALARLKQAGRHRVEDRFAPGQIVAPLVARLRLGRPMQKACHDTR